MKERVKDAMTKGCATVALHDGLEKLVQALVEPDSTCAVVIDDEERPLQIITVKDLLQVCLWQLPVPIVLEVLKFLNKSFDDLMVVREDEHLLKALEMMKRRDVSHLPVVDENGKLSGLLHGKNVLERFPEITCFDPLTELPNKGYVKLVERKIRKRSGQVGVLMIDVDDFKRINDAKGHLVGDEVLKRVAKTLKLNVRPYDEVLRFGGEEFLVVIYRCTSESLYGVAERLRTAVEQINDFDFKVTVSVGGCFVENCSFDGFASAVKRADDALYEAKRSGKNKTVLYGDFREVSAKRTITEGEGNENEDEKVLQQ